MFSNAALALVDNFDEDTINYRDERLFLRNRYNVTDLSDRKFKESFRVTKDIFEYLLEEVAPIIKERTKSNSVPLSLRMAALLNFLATGSYQRTIGDIMLHSMSQAVVSTSNAELLKAMEKKLCSKWIRFPDQEERIRYKQRFYEKTRMPGIIGCVDGTHVNMIAPIVDEHIYVDRKSNHSMNVQLICNYDLKILSVNARYPGSVHDAAIWSMSAARRSLESAHEAGERNTLLLGDSGYPLEQWLLTPFKSPNDRQRDFNTIHAQARNPIERCNGVLKATFRCLLGERTLRYQPKAVVRMVNVCCALLNICLDKNVDLPEPELFDFEPDVLFEGTDDDASASRMRNTIMDNLL